MIGSMDTDRKGQACFCDPRFCGNILRFTTFWHYHKDVNALAPDCLHSWTFTHGAGRRFKSGRVPGTDSTRGPLDSLRQFYMVYLRAHMVYLKRTQPIHIANYSAVIFITSASIFLSSASRVFCNSSLFSPSSAVAPITVEGTW